MAMPARVQLLTDTVMAAHAAPGHPERPERLGAVADGVADGAMAAGVELERPTVVPAADDDLLRVHSPWFLDALEAAADRGGGWIDGDTYVGPDSVRAMRAAAGATIQAARAVMGGAAPVAFAVVRPPGHHASGERAAGFCLVNNVALAVEALRADGIADRVAIVDWDVHHGDGTQAIFEADADLFYASTHQSPLYPGTGAPEESGSGEAVGTKRNVTLPPGSGDDAFVTAWRELLLPELERFAPAALLVSAGYDAHRDDPLAHLEVSEAGYGAVAREIGALATRLGLPGVALTLEGGYDLAALRASAAATVRGLLEGLEA
jgi:acetoin utilization deacetylase AcuC-like enzyme